MTKQELIHDCLTYPGSYLDYPFDDNWAAIRHQGNKKAFAFIFYHNQKLCINLKCDPIEADFYRSAFPCVTPAYHMNKTHWNTVYLDGSLEYSQLHQFIDMSFQLTKPKSNRKPTT